MYIERHMSSALRKMMGSFPAVLLTGPRDVGKTALLKKHFDNVPHFVLDGTENTESVKNDTMEFMDSSEQPVIIAGIHHAPEILSKIQKKIERSSNNGEYFMTGLPHMHHIDMMKRDPERICILRLCGLSTREINGDPFMEPFLPNAEYYNKRKRTISEYSGTNIWRRIHRGSSPILYKHRDEKWDDYYSEYLRNYIEHDVKSCTEIIDDKRFKTFMAACAARTGDMLNMAEMSRESRISNPTAKRWLEVLQATGIVYLLQPFRNVTSRSVRTPKLYFMDTGLASYLCGYHSPETLEDGEMAGYMFETHAVTEIIKSYRNAGHEAPIYFYRDANRREIDILIHHNGTLYPIEIKKTSTPDQKDTKHFETLRKFTSLEVSEGALVCMNNRVKTLNGRDKSIPISYI